MCSAFLENGLDGGSRVMNKLGKIAPIIIIVACLGSGFFAYELSVMKKSHLTQIAELKDTVASTTADLTKTKSTLKHAQNDLTQSNSDLAKASADLQTAKVALDQKTQEADGPKTEVADKDKELQQSNTDLAAAQYTMKMITEGLKNAGIEDIGSVDKLSDKI